MALVQFTGAELMELREEVVRLREKVRILRDAIATAQTYLQDNVVPGLEEAWLRTKP